MFILTIIEVILIIGFLIFIHEGGHYLACKACKVKVKEFAIGFGPKIFAKQGKETLFTLRALPLGGFNDILGESEKVDDERAYCNAKLHKRMFIILAGPLVNIICGILVYFIVVLFMSGVPTNVIAEIMPEMKAATSGIEVGDTILKLDDTEIHDSYDITTFLLNADETPVLFTVKKANGEIKEYNVEKTEYTGSYVIGIVSVVDKNKSFAENWDSAVKSTSLYLIKTYISVRNMFTGHFRMDQVMGPIGITSLVAETDKVSDLVYLISVISISLGVTNLLPIPALDGGKFVLLLVEGVTRKPVSTKVEETLGSIGFIFLISLAIFVATNDLVRVLRGVFG